ncbi:hypothetical protein SLS59_009082 [Nothophoma quercina]|uniref:Uncharacterized protein n=1 Tax=Nothophoma quercina TaxID=749835 RepID=A0ABR3QPG8_9PLEO
MPSTTLHSAATEHRKKRQFQPAITSYFHTAQNQDFSDDDSELDEDYHRGGPRLRTIPQAKPHHPTLAPTVPDQVQSSLLSVGMRVRKSVPEGYKTPKTLTSLHTQATTTQTPLRKPHNAFRDVHPTLEIPVDILATTLQHQRELLPFCGLNKIGGYAEQPQPTTTLNLFGGVHQAFNQPFSSQDSGYGTDNLRSKGKRGWSEEDSRPNLNISSNNFLFAIPNNGAFGDDDIPVSPLSESPPPSLPPQRTIAQPKSRRQQRHEEDLDMDLGYESRGMQEGRLAAGHASDFEEADFLDGHEIAMGGV